MRSLWHLSRHLTARADDNHAAPPHRPRRASPSLDLSCAVQARVRFLAYHRIKPHVPPLVRAPVNSFEFHRCRRTPQVRCLTLSLCRLHGVSNSGQPSFTVRTIRVSRAVRDRHFRALASVKDSEAAFAIGVLRDISAFHRYPTNSADVALTQETQFATQLSRCAATFHVTLKPPPALPLNPINPDNARTFRITAAAGTELAGPYSCGTYKTPHVAHFIPA